MALGLPRGLLAVAYLMAGAMKATQPIDKLAAQMKWPADYPGLTRFVGWSEVLGAIGLVLPLLTGHPRLADAARSPLPGSRPVCWRSAST